MSPFADCPRLQACRLLSLSSSVVRVALFYVLVGSLYNACSAQNVEGLPAVGNGTSQFSSQMLIDATAFSAAGDMCAAITAACAQVGTTGYPLGATIDARGFAGNQVCKAINITTMLNGCAAQYSGTRNATSGKLLLGEVNLYADGPSSGNYTYGTGSGPGTPALVIPAQFWGIEGVSRGADASGSSAGPGTFLSVCTGSNTPVGTGHLPPAPGSPPCTTSFPVRSFSVNSTTVSTASGVTTMTMNVSPAANFGVNIYPGELVMLVGSGSTPVAENGRVAHSSRSLA